MGIKIYKATTVKELRDFLSDCNDTDEVFAGEGSSENYERLAFYRPSGIVLKVERNGNAIKEMDL